MAIATKILSKAYNDEFDVLIAITGDRDFQDCFSAVIIETRKPVKIIGFEQTIWQGYFVEGQGLEVLSAEDIWNRAIGKCLIHQTSKQALSQELKENKNNKSVFNENSPRQGKSISKKQQKSQFKNTKKNKLGRS